MFHRLFLFLSLLTFSFFTAREVGAAPSARESAPRVSSRPNGFAVSDEIQGRIDFWKVVFTKYGKDHLVFHHREHPQIIYSVLDMAEFNKAYSGKELSRVTNRAVEEEYDRIKLMLARLADSGKPLNPAERRLYHLFSALPGRLNANLRDAANEETIRYQKGVRELFRDGLIRSGRYLHAMERVFQQEGLPVELCRLPLVESSFNYNAYSSVGAAGIWQFMRGTGKKYMRIDSLIDERKDPIMATRAAARYLAYSYQKTGSWPLAVTSYNHGLSGIMRAASQVGTKDLGTIIRNYDGASFGFASKNFYAEFMAALEVEQNAKHYFPEVEREEPWHFDEIRLGSALTFAELVRSSGANETELENLNRAFLGPIVNGRSKIPAGLIVRVPHGSGRRLMANLGRGEIVSIDDDAAEVLAGRPTKRKSAPVVIAKNTVIQREDRSLGKLGDVPAEPSISDTDPNTRVAENAPSAPQRYYRVSRGETMAKIAKRNGITLRALIEANPTLSPSKIKSGMRVVLPPLDESTERAFTAEKKLEKLAEERVESKSYKIQRGDTLSSVAKRFGVSLKRLRQLNPKAQRKLSIGQEIKLD